MTLSSARVQVIEEPAPFGDVPLAPSEATGRSEAELASAMAHLLLAATRASDARNALPGSLAYAPLGLRLAALAALMRRGSGPR